MFKNSGIFTMIGGAVIGCVSTVALLNKVRDRRKTEVTIRPQAIPASRSERDEEDGEYLFLNNDGLYKDDYDDVWNNASDEERDVFTRRSEEGKSLKEIFETPITTEEISETIGLLKNQEEEGAREVSAAFERIRSKYGKS